MSVSYSIRGTPAANNLPVPNEAALAYDFVGGVLWGSSPDTGAWIPLGGGAGGGPIIQASDTQLNSIAPTTVSFELPITTMYQATLYYGPSGTSGTNEETWVPTITWTDPTGNQLVAGPNGPTIVLGDAVAGSPPDGGPNFMQSYSIPFLCLGGTPIVITGEYTGTPFPMNIAIRIVAMP